MQHLHECFPLCNDQRCSEVIKNDAQFDYTLNHTNIQFICEKNLSGDFYIKLSTLAKQYARE